VALRPELAGLPMVSLLLAVAVLEVIVSGPPR
jgi:hypothetical protein